MATKESKIIVEIDKSFYTGSMYNAYADWGSMNSPISSINDVGEVGKQSTKSLFNMSATDMVVLGVATGLTLQVANYALNNIGAYTGNYVLQNDINNLQKMVGLLNPVSTALNWATRNNNIYKANLQAQELREITNTTTSQVLQSKGRGV